MFLNVFHSFKEELTRADLRLSLLQKVKLKIDKDLNLDNKVLQNGCKYTQNSTTLLFSINFIHLVDYFLFLDRVELFTFVLTKPFTKSFTKSFTKWFTKTFISFKRSFTKTTLTCNEITTITTGSGKNIYKNISLWTN